MVARTADALVVWRCQGIFFIGYCISMLPSNLFILWLGAPNWLAIIIVAWGVIGAATSAVKNHWEFYLLRFLLGLAEGGASARSACMHWSPLPFCWRLMWPRPLTATMGCASDVPGVAAQAPFRARPLRPALAQRQSMRTLLAVLLLYCGR